MTKTYTMPLSRSAVTTSGSSFARPSRGVCAVEHESSSAIHVVGGGPAFFAATEHMGLEGIVSKRRDQPYTAGRHGGWLKSKCVQRQEFVVGGFTDPEGMRAGLGALLIGYYERDRLVFSGKVGTGFNENTLASLYRKFKPLVRSEPAFVDPPREKGVTYLKPKLVAQVSFQEWTADRKLCQPVFLGLRDDKRPEEVQLPAKGSV